MGIRNGRPALVVATPAALKALARLRRDRGPGFSLPAGEGMHFITRSRVFSPAEFAAVRRAAQDDRRSLS